MDRVKEYIHQKSIERKEYRPLSSGPSSPPPSREKARYWECPDEKARYWECPGEKASKSPTLAMFEPLIAFERCQSRKKFNKI
ncbi:hypothetical protein ALC56_11841 [Trachymyrmex septentrionalis]|uniref:Uncharacterized protein n=1 Tax=Trachymyrmex septentrionalis TaxID=34720 RepID=A0A151JTL7_9HYME|nr:hypothetical protein ALC56_11841 [Trachymyrmex septentrionalis]